MRLVKWILGILLVLVLLAVAALFLLPVDRIASLATDRFEAATGRSLTLSGTIRPSLYPNIGVGLGAVEIANADWSDAGPMVSAKKLSVAVDLGALLGGEVKIRSITIVEPVIRLERSPDGQANWAFGEQGDQVDESDGSGGPGVFVENASIRGGRLVYTDHSSGQQVEITEFDLNVDQPGQSDLSLVADGKLNGVPMSATAIVSGLSSGSVGNPTPIEATLNIGSAQASLSGEIAPIGGGDLAGEFNATIEDTGALISLLGIDPPAIPEGAGNAVRIAGDLLVSGGELSLTQSQLGLDHNELAGDIGLSLAGDKPHLTANLTTGDFDLSALAAEDDEPSTTSGWSTDPIDLSGLGAIDADISLAAQSIDLGLAKFDRSRLQATLRGGQLDIDIREMAAYGGTMTGLLSVSGAGGMTLAGDITASGVALQAFLTDFLGSERITGSGDMDLQFRGSGGSMDAVMNSLSGNGNIAFGQGELLGIDLIAMLRNLDGSFGQGGSTIFNSITASFDVADGVINNVDLSFLAPLADALGDGTIGLGQRVMNYRVTPKLLRGEAGQAGISVPILITGPWDNLSFRPDLAGLIDGAAKKAVQDAGEAAKAVVEEGIGGAGTDLKETIEDGIKKGLGGLLGGN